MDIFGCIVLIYIPRPIKSFLSRSVHANGTKGADLSTHITILEDVSLQCFHPQFPGEEPTAP